MSKEQKQIKSTNNGLYILLGVVNRLIWLIGFPFYCIYMMIPLFWLLDIPYWVITERDLMKDFSRIYQN
jgi:hypothetical protein